jgi:hypothetical protein
MRGVLVLQGVTYYMCDMRLCYSTASSERTGTHRARPENRCLEAMIVFIIRGQAERSLPARIIRLMRSYIIVMKRMF